MNLVIVVQQYLNVFSHYYFIFSYFTQYFWFCGCFTLTRFIECIPLLEKSFFCIRMALHVFKVTLVSSLQWPWILPVLFLHTRIATVNCSWTIKWPCQNFLGWHLGPLSFLGHSNKTHLDTITTTKQQQTNTTPFLVWWHCIPWVGVRISHNVFLECRSIKLSGFWSGKPKKLCNIFLGVIYSFHSPNEVELTQ